MQDNFLIQIFIDPSLRGHRVAEAISFLTEIVSRETFSKDSMRLLRAFALAMTILGNM